MKKIKIICIKIKMGELLDRVGGVRGDNDLKRSFILISLGKGGKKLQKFLRRTFVLIMVKTKNKNKNTLR